MSREPETPSVNPGSDGAVARGCTCAVLDNHRGAGIWLYDEATQKRTVRFWINDACPLHGSGAFARS